LSASNAQHLILIVEDSPEDFEISERALRRAGVDARILNCFDGDDALDFLTGTGHHAGRDTNDRPSLILLDLNLPGTDGREVLREIKNNRELRRIPVVVLTTSADARDVERSYREGAASYIQKPVNLAALNRVMERIKEYWFDTVMLGQVQK
jgi:CheY-like chemotaxis protein